MKKRGKRKRKRSRMRRKKRNRRKKKMEEMCKILILFPYHFKLFCHCYLNA